MESVWLSGRLNGSLDLAHTVVFDFRTAMFQTVLNHHGQVCKLLRNDLPPDLLLATRAHYRSIVEILQECIQRFSKTFLMCFLYCKFFKEAIDCTTISTASPDQANF